MAPDMPRDQHAGMLYRLELSGNMYNFIEDYLTSRRNEIPLRFSRRALERFTSNFKGHVLGSGTYGIVYKGEVSFHVPAAVKVLNESVTDDIMEEQFMAEVSLMGKANHRNLVRLYGYCFDDNIKALVYEYTECGSLDKILYNYHRNVEWVQLHHIALETAKGLAYLHEGCNEQIIHYDIKPGNVLLDTNLNPKIGDFGLAKLWVRDLSPNELGRYRGTRGYAAPEMCLGTEQITEKCDIYSFGMMLFEIMSSRKKNNQAEDWFPGHVWKMYENRQLKELLVDCGIEKNDTEKAETFLIVALCCAQYFQNERPPMSNVVMMLEGVLQPPPPRNPFQHYGNSRVRSTTPWVSSERDTWDARKPAENKKKKKKKSTPSFFDPDDDN